MRGKEEKGEVGSLPQYLASLHSYFFTGRMAAITVWSLP